MTKSTQAVLVGATAAVLGTAAAVAVEGIVFRRRIGREVADLFRRSAGAKAGVVTEADLAGTPEPVRGWLRRAQIVGKQCPSAVRLRQQGEFRTAEGASWMPFVAEEYFTTNPPGFLWRARFTLAPLVTLEGRDRYVEGRGDLDMRLLSAIPVAHGQGPEMDQGDLLRYLDEIMWFPAAALSPYIIWEALDAHSARATMQYRGVSATAVFVFNTCLELTDVVAERYRAVGGRYSLDTWRTRVGEYSQFNGVWMPAGGEGIWELRGGNFSYIRLRVTHVEYDKPAQYED